MAKVTYKSYNQNDSLLFPHCIGDFIPENDSVRVLDAIVEHLDISAFLHFLCCHDIVRLISELHIEVLFLLHGG